MSSSTVSAPAATAVETIPRGASIHRLVVDGKNILLSLPHPSLYTKIDTPYFGQTIGRVTNRIENGRLENLNGRAYELPKNNPPNLLHGGEVGWGRREWKGPSFVRRGTWDDGIEPVKPKGWTAEGDDGEETATQREGCKYELESWDGEDGFPGSLMATVWYSEGRGQKGEVVLDVEYEAKFKDSAGGGVQETVVGMTNHSYFNLNGPDFNIPATLDSHVAELSTSTYLPGKVSNPEIPDGSLAPHPNVPPQPNTPFPLKPSPTSETVPIDHCFIVDPKQSPSSIPLDTRSLPLQNLIKVHSKSTGLSLRIDSTEPAFQFYTGAFINVPAWEAGEVDGEQYPGGVGFSPHSGFCVEPQRYVNAAGREEWRSMCLLKQGDMFGARSRYWAWKE